MKYSDHLRSAKNIQSKNVIHFYAVTQNHQAHFKCFNEADFDTTTTCVTLDTLENNFMI